MSSTDVILTRIRSTVISKASQHRITQRNTRMLQSRGITSRNTWRTPEQTRKRRCSQSAGRSATGSCWASSDMRAIQSCGQTCISVWLLRRNKFSEDGVMCQIPMGFHALEESNTLQSNANKKACNENYRHFVAWSCECAEIFYALPLHMLFGSGFACFLVLQNVYHHTKLISSELRYSLCLRTAKSSAFAVAASLWSSSRSLSKSS